jgi:hypothetical protein
MSTTKMVRDAKAHASLVKKLSQGDKTGAYKHLHDKWNAERKACQGEIASHAKELSNG